VYSTSRDHDTLGIDCRSDGKTRKGACVKEIGQLDGLTLVAEPAPGATFVRWQTDPEDPTLASDDPHLRLTSTQIGATRHVVAYFK
jgi:hypothetical protein